MLQQQTQEPPKSTIEIIQRFDECAQLLSKDLDSGETLALQMILKEFPVLQNILAEQQQLTARISTLEQQAQEEKEQKKLKRNFKLQERLKMQSQLNEYDDQFVAIFEDQEQIKRSLVTIQQTTDQRLSALEQKFSAVNTPQKVAVLTWLSGGSIFSVILAYTWWICVHKR